jgi:hypothetical protein
MKFYYLSLIIFNFNLENFKTQKSIYYTRFGKSIIIL